MIGETIAVLIGLVIGLLMTKLMPNLFNPLRTISEKAPFFLSITLSILLGMAILSGSSTLLYILLIFSGLAGILLSYIYSRAPVLFGGAGFSRDNVGLALVISGGLHLIILLMLVSASGRLIYTHTLLPLNVVLFQEVPVIVLLPIIFLVEFLFVALPEELYFRAYLVDAVGKTVGYPISVGVAMATWLGLHAITRIPAGAAIALVPIGAGGLALTWLYMATRNAGVSALSHALYNTVIEFTAFLFEVSPATALTFFFLSLIAELGIGAWILLGGEPRIEI